MSQLDSNELSKLAGLLGSNESSSQSGRDIEDTMISTENIEPLEPEPLDAQTELSFSSNPVSKIFFVFGSVSLVLLIVWMLLNGFHNREQFAKTDIDNSGDLEEKVTLSSSEDSEKAHLKTELALAEQKRQLELLKQNQEPPVEVVRTETPPVQPVVQVQPTPKNKPESQPKPEQKIDPHEAQAKALALGSFGSSSQINTSSNTSITNEESNLPTKTMTEQEVPNFQETSQSQMLTQAQLEAPLFRESIETHINTMIIPAGTTVLAHLKQAIAWDDEESLLGQQFRIALAEPLLDNKGSIIAPVGSLVLVSVVNYSSTGLVVLQPETLIINGRNLSLDKNHVSVHSIEGEYLLAKKVQPHQNSSDSGTIARDILGTAGDLGIIDSSISRRIERTGRRFQGNNRSRKINSSLWVLPENTQLQIFFSQTINIKYQESSPILVPNPGKDRNKQSHNPNSQISLSQQINNSSGELDNSKGDGLFFPVAMAANQLEEQQYQNPEIQVFCQNNGSLCNFLRI